MISAQDAYRKETAMWDLIHTLLRFGIGKKRTEHWGYLSVNSMRSAVGILIEKLSIQEEEIKGQFDTWSNTINPPIKLTVDTADTVTFTFSDIHYYIDDYVVWFDDSAEVAELATLDLHHQFHQSNPTPNTYGPRCRCQSPSSFAIDSS